METVTLNVQGMTCSMCVKHVTEALSNIDGVHDAVVSLEANSASVTYDTSKTNIGAMLEAISEEGYTASPN